MEAPERVASRFEREATETLSQIKLVFTDMLATLGVRRPVELQKKLKLDVTLSWQIFKVAAERSALAAGAAMPSRTNVEKFAKHAAANGIGAAEIASLATAYDQFEQVVERHAGDRTSFISLVTAAAGMSDDWLAADLQHRRNMFRGMSHVMGVQARARMVAYILADNPESESHPFRMLAVSGYINLRTLREIDRVRVHGLRIQGRGDDPDADFLTVRRKPFALAGDGSLIEEFCSQPLPEIQVDSGELSHDSWVQTSLVRPDVGNLGITTVAFVEQFWMQRLPTYLRQLTTIPTEVLATDLIVPAGLIDGHPSLEVFLGDDRPANRAPDLMPVIGNYEATRLGQGPGVLATSDMARYAEMIRAVAAAAAIDLDGYETWRVRLEYPVYQSTSRVSWKTTDASDPAAKTGDA